MSKNLTTWGYNIPKLAIEGALTQQNIDVGDASVFEYIKNGVSKSGIMAIQTSNMVTSYLYATVETGTWIQALRFYIDTTKLLVSRVSITLNSEGRTIYNASVLNFQST